MKSICFKEPLFHATIEGRKTQTRRIIKPQPLYDVIEVYGQYFNGVAYCEREIISRYKVGDIVYLKEPYYESESGLIVYRHGYPGNVPSHYENIPEINELPWSNKLFMPESAARYFIKITAVRAERLQEISDEDCLKEGIWMAENVGRKGVSYWYGGCINSPHTAPQQAYAALIDKINGRGTWEGNPWVFVYDYELYNKE